MPIAPPPLTHTDDRNFAGAQSPLPGAAQIAAAASPDWDLMFDAVTARLRDIAGAVAALPGLAGLPQQGRNKVLECAEALDQLHASMSRQEALHRALQQQLDSAHADLARACASLADTQHRARHDALTTLPKREHFHDVLGRALLKSDETRVNKRPSLALLYLDLDGFKPINDQHGHAVGDRLLRIVATRLARAVRAGDCVGRMGGDEFACLLGGVDDRQQLSHLACKLFDTVSAPLQIGRLQLTVRPSIGIAVCPTDGGTADTLLKRSDAAMYRAKRAQSGYAFFDRRADLAV